MQGIGLLVTGFKTLSPTTVALSSLLLSLPPSLPGCGGGGQGVWFGEFGNLSQFKLRGCYLVGNLLGSTESSNLCHGTGYLSIRVRDLLFCGILWGEGISRPSSSVTGDCPHNTVSLREFYHPSFLPSFMIV